MRICKRQRAVETCVRLAFAVTPLILRTADAKLSFLQILCTMKRQSRLMCGRERQSAVAAWVALNEFPR